MVLNIDFDNLYFGSDDAERDEKNDFLIKVFIETSFYKRVLKQRRELVTGRKGSGKSAICLKLNHLLSEDGYKVSLITPDSLSRQKIEDIGADSITKEEIYLLTWRYVFLVKTALSFIELVEDLKIPRLRYDSSLVKEIKAFLGSNGEVPSGFGRNLSSLAGVISKIKVSAFGIGGEVERKSLGDDSKQDLANLIPQFEERLSVALEYLSDNVKPIFLLVDKVDEIWTKNEESQLMISGMLRAVHQFNDRFKEVNIIAFLRSDIFDALKFHDIDKTPGQEERLQWNSKGIKELLARRAYFSATGISAIEEAEDITEDSLDILKSIFPEDVNGEEPIDYILSRTLMRPREAIQFCNESLKIAHDKSQDFVSSDDILDAENQYSAWKMRDLVSEFQIQYPYLDILIPMFNGFKNHFTKSEFSSLYQESLAVLKEKYPGLNSYSEATMLKELYDIGFLGSKNLDSTASAIYHYSRGRLAGNPYLSQNQVFTIHPIYHSALGLNIESGVSVNQSISINIGYIVGSVVSGGNVSVNQTISSDIPQRGDNISSSDS